MGAGLVRAAGGCSIQVGLLRPAAGRLGKGRGMRQALHTEARRGLERLGGGRGWGCLLVGAGPVGVLPQGHAGRGRAGRVPSALRAAHHRVAAGRPCSQGGLLLLLLLRLGPPLWVLPLVRPRLLLVVALMLSRQVLVVGGTLWALLEQGPLLLVLLQRLLRVWISRARLRRRLHAAECHGLVPLPHIVQLRRLALVPVLCWLGGWQGPAIQALMRRAVPAVPAVRAHAIHARACLVEGVAPAVAGRTLALRVAATGLLFWLHRCLLPPATGRTATLRMDKVIMDTFIRLAALRSTGQIGSWPRRHQASSTAWPGCCKPRAVPFMAVPVEAPTRLQIHTTPRPICQA